MLRYVFQIALFHGYVPIAKVLIDHGANIYAQDSIALFPAHYAVDGGHLPAIRFTLDLHFPNASENNCKQPVTLESLLWRAGTRRARMSNMNRKTNLNNFIFLVELHCPKDIIAIILSYSKTKAYLTDAFVSNSMELQKTLRLADATGQAEVACLIEANIGTNK